MLGEDYPRLLEDLIATLPGAIELPPSHQNYFKERGPTAPYESNSRRAVRTSVRTRGILIPQKWLPVVPRNHDPSLIYTKDFSKTGFGFIADHQIFPGEVVRILLATFWMQIAVRRCRRLGPNCYEVGGTLVSQHEPNSDAFSLLDTQNA